MQQAQSSRDVVIGAGTKTRITYVSAAYTVLETDRVIECTGTGTYTVTLPAPSGFPAGEMLLIHKKGGTGEVTVSTPSGGLFATPVFAVDGLTAIDDYKLLLNVHGLEWVEIKEVTT